MPPPTPNVLRGTLDLLILKTLTLGTPTASGRRALGAETTQWRRYVDAVDLILGVR